MATSLIPRSQRWLQWATGLLLIAAACTQPLVTAAAAPQIPAGAARIWFYQYERGVYSRALIPAVVANGTYVGPLPAGRCSTVMFPRGITISRSQTPPALMDRRRTSTLPAGQQAFVKLVFWKTGHDAPRPQTQGLLGLARPRTDRGSRGPESPLIEVER